jgi:5'-nucleotidase/UDP-sugar diphosphatase
MGTFLLLHLLLALTPVNAKLIQILHTNDTHSYLESTPHSEGRGGVAELKSLMDYYKKTASDQNMKTISMDAGDFTEGNFYYLADKGRKVFDIHNEMGYDVSAIGNHDYLMGTRELDKILGEKDYSFSLLTANLEINSNLKNLRAKILPYKELVIDGIKIAILGLTTDQILYKWRWTDGKITNPYKSAGHYETILKDRNNDFIIALTHLGVLGDIKLAESTKNIDLIVGGHSHTALFKPSYGVNKNKLQVPIVQAGMHTEYLGRLILDLQKGKPLKIVSYELIPIKYEAYDFKIKAIVDQANNDLENTYGKDWLNEKIGYSDLKIGDKNGSRKWAYFITDALKEKADTDIAIHTPYMNGDDFPIGSIDRRELINSFPRIFEFSEMYGWDIYTAKVKGVWLRTVFDTLLLFKQPLTFSGLKFVYKKDKMGLRYKHLMVNGQEINPFKTYKVAFTEGIVRGAIGVGSSMETILRNPKNTHFKIWKTLEEKLTKETKNSGDSKNASIEAISEDNHQLIMPE